MVNKLETLVIAGVLVAGVGLAQAQESGSRLAPVIDRTGGVAPSSNPAAQTFGTANGNAGSLESRIVRLERLMENQALVDMMLRLDTMQSTVQALQGQVEELTFELQSMEQRQRDLYLDIDRRIHQMEQAGTSAPVAEPPMAGSGTVPPVAQPAVVSTTPTAPVQPADPAQERDAYQNAFQELKDGRYEQAISAFESFLSRYPAGSYAGNAQYWLGEANYVTRRFQAAESEFKKVLAGHPDSPKVADALLKLGFTYYELGKWDSARSSLNEVKTRFPNTTVAKLAENRLQKMRLEGR